ncbi:RNA-directed DNA polymerase [Mucilaginibacter terrigena]|uniref:RNA-directed DNA polymerase n=1 Tax=Mucilaginibacter terrigena TaxID=2492395 RepID=A0A4Q5LJV1_9SPHI|nr:reverse transcriptase family protein [Mucilaginibacter terrigena]RYU89605.1 RNA-directed DNA polymerase [Mucilaginibacter terrigena]
MHWSPIISTSLIKDLKLSPKNFYHKHLRPKMKYGAPQIDHSNNSCRLRIVTKPIYSLKMLQKAVKAYLDIFSMPYCMHGGATGDSNFDNALVHINNRFYYTIDLKNFFGTISNSRIHQTLISLGHTWHEARNITRIATLDGCLPQGAPTSTILACLAFSPTALLLEDFCKERNITFTVYIDDLTFSSPNCFKHHTDQIIKIIKTNGFCVNHHKIHYRINNCEITGIIVNKGQLTLPNKILKNLNKAGVKQYVASFTDRYEKYLLSKKAALLSQSGFVARRGIEL